ncbi:MAG TPA: hypothetical protein VIH37_00635, partial [Candidatus Limnocylindrales bacterium]
MPPLPIVMVGAIVVALAFAAVLVMGRRRRHDAEAARRASEAAVLQLNEDDIAWRIGAVDRPPGQAAEVAAMAAAEAAEAAAKFAAAAAAAAQAFAAAQQDDIKGAAGWDFGIQSSRADAPASAAATATSGGDVLPRVEGEADESPVPVAALVATAPVEGAVAASTA